MSREQIVAVLKSNMERIIEGARGREVRDSDSLVADFGADSLEIVEVVSRTMKELKIKVPRVELSEPKNIGELVSLFERAAARTAAA
jgi:acyl carrier protein